MSDLYQGRLSVLDFRRRRMAVQWNLANGEWSSHEEAPERVHGIALIRPSQSNIGLYGFKGVLVLQIGTEHIELTGSPRKVQISCERTALSLGSRREFIVRADSVLFEHQYWAGSGPDFFDRLAAKAADATWRDECARRWTEGESSPHLRESWAG